MKRHAQTPSGHHHHRAAPQSTAAAAPPPPKTTKAEEPEPPLQFDSNMDWPSSNSSSSSSGKGVDATEQARHPLPFPTAHIAPCARITTRIYHPPNHLSGNTNNSINNNVSGGRGMTQGSQGRVETVRDVLVEIAGPSRDGLGRPIIPMPIPAPPQPQAQPTAVRSNNTRPGAAAAAVGSRGGAVVGRGGAGGVIAGGGMVVEDDDTGAGFTGAGTGLGSNGSGSGSGSFLLGGMAHSVSLNGQTKMQQGPNVPNNDTNTAGAEGGSASAKMSDDDDDSMSSGWSTSDSDMSVEDWPAVANYMGPFRYPEGVSDGKDGIKLGLFERLFD